ncbi:hypothetical protein ACVU7I_04405 [Patulibacter sp. S7RM1-6]
MLRLLGAEVRRITGRRASFYGAIAFAVLVTVLGVVLDDPNDGNQALDHFTTAGRFAGLLGIVVMGALAGSYDTANGTMRYLVLTGVPRWQLGVVRLLGIMVAALPMAAIVLVISYVAAAPEAGGVTGDALVHAIWAVLATLWAWGLVSAGIGMLMRSNGPAIAASIVLFFGGTLITGIVAGFVSETLANYLLPVVFDQVAEWEGKGGPADYRLALGTAVVTLLVWLGAIVALGLARVQRDEY